MSSPPKSATQAQVLSSLEARLRGPLRELLLLQKYTSARRFVDYLLAGVMREMWSGGDGQNWGLTQQEVGDAVGLSRGRVQQLLSDNLRTPDAEERMPELKLLMLTQLSAATGPLTHEGIVQRLRQVYGASADGRELAMRSLAELNQLVRGGTVTLGVGPTGTIEYGLDQHGGFLAVEPAEIAIPRLREEISRHLDFHEETGGRSGIGLRTRARYTADITQSLGLEMDARIRESVGLILAEFEARARDLRAADPEGVSDPELPIALFLVASHVALRALEGGANNPPQR